MSRVEEDDEAPSDVRSYLELSYWNRRFAKEKHYEWFKDYSHFQHLIHAHVPRTAKILEVGCGNSRLSEQMYEDGYTNITATDLSSVAVERKQEHCSAMGYEGIKVCVADMLNLPFADGSFDVVLEKGVIDVLFVDSGSPWNPKPESARRVETMLKEAYRVLSPTGMMISVAFGQASSKACSYVQPVLILEQPHFRRPFFEAEGFDWSMQYSTFGEAFHYFFYTLQRSSRAGDRTKIAEGKPIVVKDLLHEYMDEDDYLKHTLIDDDDETSIRQ